MGTPIIQTAFTKGELTPGLYARVDLASYHVGAALMRNFFVDIKGGASTRPGTHYCARCKVENKPVRLIPFQFSTVQTYVLEFGDKYMRVLLNGGQVLEPTTDISGATKANPCVVTDVAHGYDDGDEVYITGVGGMTELNGESYIVTNSSVDDFELWRQDGSSVNSTAYHTYTSGGTAARIFTLETDYDAEDLARLKYAQSADVMTLTHPDYPAADLTRTEHWDWTLTDITFQPSISAPGSITGVASSTAVGTTHYVYVVTAVSEDGGEESRYSGGVNVASDPMSTTVGAYITVGWGTVTGASKYNIYRTAEVPAGSPPVGSLFGFVGSALAVGFVDVNIAPDFTQTPPLGQDPFAGDNNPGAVGYYQQRKTFGGSNALPETFNMTQTGNYQNMDTSDPIRANDAITGTLASQEVNAIRHLVSLDSLIALTSKGAWQLSGGSQGDVVTPSNIIAKAQAYNGCSEVIPLVIGSDILYVQDKGSVIRDLTYNFYVNLYTGTDISVLSNHLFFGHKIKEWSWAEEPFKIVWAIREDGILMSLTFLKEQEVYGWSRHDTAGQFRSVTTISEGDTDAVYFVVDRFILGQTRKYIERLSGRNFYGDVRQSLCLDSSLRYPYTYPNATITPSATTGTNRTFTTDADAFTADSVGNIIRMNNGRLQIVAYNDARSVQVDIIDPLIYDLPVPGATIIYNNAPAAYGTWTCTKPVTAVNGLSHLNSQTVSILADGVVLTPRTVINGAVTLDQAASDIVVGLPYTCQLMTLPLDLNSNPTVSGKRKDVNAATLLVQDTRGLKVGPDFDHLKEIKERAPALPLNAPIPLFSGFQRINLPSVWTVPGQVCIQQDNPLPATVLGVVPEVSIGDTSQ